MDLLRQILDVAAEQDLKLSELTLADTMAWATPASIKRLVGAVRERYPSLRITLHLHDTRGMGIANAYAGLEMGVDSFDAAVAGLGGCPFAAHAGAAGNVCTEDLVFMCDEMGIDTGVNLERMIAVAQLAEDIVGHPLPGIGNARGKSQSAARKAALGYTRRLKATSAARSRRPVRISCTPTAGSPRRSSGSDREQRD